MKKKNFISINEFSQKHDIEVSFISSLQQTGLIEITMIEEKAFIDVNQLPHLEKITRLYFELDINLEGIESIIHLLLRINSLQEEVTILQNRLRIYETNE